MSFRQSLITAVLATFLWQPAAYTHFPGHNSNHRSPTRHQRPLSAHPLLCITRSYDVSRFPAHSVVYGDYKYHDVDTLFARICSSYRHFSVDKLKVLSD